LLERDQLFLRLGGGQGAAQGLDEQGQVVGEIDPQDHQVPMRLGTEVGDPETDELIRIRTARLDFFEQFASAGQLLRTTRRGREANLLIRQLLQGRLHERCHGHPSFLAWVRPGHYVCAFRHLRAEPRGVIRSPSSLFRSLCSVLLKFTALFRRSFAYNEAIG